MIVPFLSSSRSQSLLYLVRATSDPNRGTEEGSKTPQPTSCTTVPSLAVEWFEWRVLREFPSRDALRKYLEQIIQTF